MRALVILCLLSTVAFAQPLKERAKQHVSAGLAAQDAGRYDEAIAEYEQGYALIPHPEILFNLAQAHRLNGDAGRALAYYRRYLAIEPNGRVARDAERWVHELESQTEEVDLNAKPDAPAAPAARPGRGKRIAGIALAAAGGLSLGVGLKFGLDARGISDDLSAHDGPWTDAMLARQDDGRRAETRMYIFTAAGTAALAGGVVLYLLGSRTTAVTPTADGVAVMGTF